MPGTIRSVLRNERPVIRSDGSPRRDYVFVLDIVDGYIRLAEAMTEGRLTGEAFNFGLDNPLSALEMAERIIALSPYPDLAPRVLGAAENEIQDQYLDSSKARRMLGWETEYSLEDGLRETMRWYADFLAEADAG